MKKILSLFMMAIAIFTLASCFDNTNEKSFEIASYPKTTYVLNEEFSWEGVIVKIGGVEYGYAAAKQAAVVFPEVADIKTDKAGTYSLSVKYGSLTATFQYTVLDSYFANGDGTLYNPYQISTIDQYIAMNKVWNKTTYFVLVNDIDIASGDNKIEKEGYNVKNIVLDGHGYALRNVNHRIFDNTVDCVIKNLSIYCGLAGEYWESDVQGIVFSVNSRTTFENISTYGSIKILDGKNASIYGFAGTGNVVLKNCINYASIVGINTREVSVFTTGSLAGNKGQNAWYLIGCKNYGDVYGLAAAFLTCNKAYISSYDATYVIDSETVNYGKIVSTLGSSNMFAANTCSSGNFQWKEGDKISDIARLRVYRYDSAIGIKGSADIESAQFEVLGDKVLEGLTTVDPISLTINDSVMKLDINSNGYFELACDPVQDKKVAKYVVKVSGYLEYRESDGNIKEGYSGNTPDGEYFSIVCNRQGSVSALEAVNALKLRPLTFQNVRDANYNVNPVDMNLSILDATTVDVDRTGTIPTVTIDGVTYYVNDVAKNNGYAYVAVNSKVIYTITALSEDGLPLCGSVTAVVNAK